MFEKYPLQLRIRQLLQKQSLKISVLYFIKFRTLAHNDSNKNTRIAYTSFVPILFRNISGEYNHLISAKLDIIANRKAIETKGEDVLANSSEKQSSVKKSC